MTPTELLGILMTLERRVPDRHITVDESMAAAWFESLRSFSAAAGLAAARSWPGPAFPSAHEFLIECQAAARGLIAAEQATYAAGQLPMSACPNHCSDGWIETDANGRGTWAPCARCRPVEHAVARHRSLAGHDENRCGDCITLRKGRGAEPGWLTNARVAAEQVNRAGYDADAVVDDDEARAAMERIRSMLAKARAPGVHNHRITATEPCPVCGGCHPRNRRLMAVRAALVPAERATAEF